MSFRVWLESTAQYRMALCRAIDAVASKDKKEMNLAGDWLKDMHEPLGEEIATYAQGGRVSVERSPKAYSSWDDQISFHEEEPEHPVVSYSYKPREQLYVVWIRVNIEPEPIEFSRNVPKNNMINGSPYTERRRKIMREIGFKGREGRNITKEHLPDYLSVPMPSEKALRNLLQSLLAHEVEPSSVF